MADEPGTDVVSTWVRRLGPAIEIMDKIGFKAFLILLLTILLGFVGGIALGYLPLKPLDDLSTEHKTLERAIEAAQERQKGEIARTTEMLERLTALISRMDRRAQLIDCARLNDVDLRKRCLE